MQSVDLVAQKLHNPWLGLREGSVLGCEDWESVQRNLHAGTNKGPVKLIRHLQGVETWF